jgi:hypothetical protein
MELTGVGVWSSQLRYSDPSESAEAAAELDDLGFAALWIPDVGGPVFDAVAHLLGPNQADRDRHGDPEPLDALGSRCR